MRYGRTSDGTGPFCLSVRVWIPSAVIGWTGWSAGRGAPKRWPLRLANLDRRFYSCSERLKWAARADHGNTPEEPPECPGARARHI